MRAEKIRKLEAVGWRRGDAREFLGLSDHEVAYIELRLRLARGLRARRTSRGLSQTELAQAVSSSQSRVAKMEAGDPSVSVDLLIRSLLTLGTTSREIGRMISARCPRRGIHQATERAPKRL